MPKKTVVSCDYQSLNMDLNYTLAVVHQTRISKVSSKKKLFFRFFFLLLFLAGLITEHLIFFTCMGASTNCALFCTYRRAFAQRETKKIRQHDSLP